jgi:Cft2 family RNA processing exonuclease
MFQGTKKLKENNYAPFSFNPAEIDFVLLTHAHIDHSGLLPKLVKGGFRGPIYTTGATADLSAVMLPDSAHIQESEVERKNRKAARAGENLLTPIYTTQDAYESVQHLQSYEYEQSFSPAPGINVKFLEAGHILGSAMVMLTYNEGGREKKMLFSGDIGDMTRQSSTTRRRLTPQTTSSWKRPTATACTMTKAWTGKPSRNSSPPPSTTPSSAAAMWLSPPSPLTAVRTFCWS